MSKTMEDIVADYEDGQKITLTNPEEVAEALENYIRESNLLFDVVNMVGELEEDEDDE